MTVRVKCTAPSLTPILTKHTQFFASINHYITHILAMNIWATILSITLWPHQAHAWNTFSYSFMCFVLKPSCLNTQTLNLYECDASYICTRSCILWISCGLKTIKISQNIFFPPVRSRFHLSMPLLILHKHWYCNIRLV